LVNVFTKHAGNCNGENRTQNRGERNIVLDIGRLEKVTEVSVGDRIHGRERTNFMGKEKDRNRW